jgi:hypothetical protein
MPVRVDVASGPGPLAASGLQISWKPKDPTMVRALVADEAEATRLDGSVSLSR